MLLELCIILPLDLLQIKHLTNGDQWKGHVMIQTYNFDMICLSFPDCRGEC